MSKQIPKAKKTFEQKTKQTPYRFIYLFLLIAYGYATVLTPNLLTLDSNGPKFLVLSLLNLVSFIYLFSRNEIKTRPEWYYAFFNNRIGIAYALVILISLLSFFKAFNVLESVMHFTKIFTTFTAAYLISVIIITDKRNILYLCIAMTLLLVYDSFSVFADINKYINKNLRTIGEIKSVYSNKNILAAAIFIKIPFAVWLMVFNRNWMRTVGILGIFTGVLALFFLSNRAFYLGIFAISSFLLIIFFIQYKQTHDRYYLKLGGGYILLIVSTFLIYSTTVQFYYPKTYDANERSVGARLATIATADNSKFLRTEGWKRSWHVFKEDPLLGIGLGNWKIATLKEENLNTENFKYQVKAHNDFIEITTETGIFGGLIYISIFFLIVWVFIKELFKNAISEGLSFFFLAAFGIICYSFDAFFNFPQDRPEIQSLFALYIGLAIAISSLQKHEKDSSIQNQDISKVPLPNPLQNPNNQTQKQSTSIFRIPIFVIGIVMLSLSVYIFNLYFKSLKLQLIVADDIKRNNLHHPASLFLDGFPAIPSLTVAALPIAVQKARYLIVEKRYDEAIAMLKNDKTNPNDALSKGLIAEAYLNAKNLDSSLVYAQIMYKMKPKNFQNISFICERLMEKGKQKESEALMDDFLSKTKKNKEAWIYISTYYYNYGNIKKAASVIDEAAIYFPTDTLIAKQKEGLDFKALILPYQDLYDAAVVAYNTMKFKEAADYYSNILSKMPDFIEGYENRAFCHYFNKEYSKSNMDLNVLVSKGRMRPDLYNLRGVNYNNLKNMDEACKNYKIAADMGNKDGIDNYAKLCQQRNELLSNLK